MKKYTLLLFCNLYFFLPTTVTAQFSFTQTTGTYSDLASPISINNGIAWDNSIYTIPVGFDFTFIGQKYDTLFLETAGRVVFDTNTFQKGIYPFYADLKDKGYDSMSASQSPLSYELTGTAGNRIFKIEFKNATFNSDIASNISFQLWLYENDNSIESHIGSNNIADFLNAYDGNTGPMVGLVYDYDFSVHLVKNAFLLSGAPSSAISKSTNTHLYLDSTPSANTIYRFESTVGVNDLSGIIPVQTELFPNPNSGSFSINITTKEEQTLEISLINLTGQLIFNEKINSFAGTLNKEIHLSEPSKGIYFLRIVHNKGVFNQKVIVN